MQLIRHAPSLRQGCDIYRSAVGEVTDRRSVHRQAFSPQAGGQVIDRGSVHREAVCGRLAVGRSGYRRGVCGGSAVGLFTSCMSFISASCASVAGGRSFRWRSVRILE